MKPVRKAVLPAAGFGTRFLPFTRAVPKEMIPLVDKPVIAVPTSVGYGANLGGLSALLTMINSCANGIAVVNIDNGYGAGYLATQINRLGVHDEEA